MQIKPVFCVPSRTGDGSSVRFGAFFGISTGFVFDLSTKK